VTLGECSFAKPVALKDRGGERFEVPARPGTVSCSDQTDTAR
jgi:hypothetical protein